MIRNQVSTPAADEIRITREFDAPRSLVWKAWTTPAMLVKWFGCAATSPEAGADIALVLPTRRGGSQKHPHSHDSPDNPFRPGSRSVLCAGYARDGTGVEAAADQRSGNLGIG